MLPEIQTVCTEQLIKEIRDSVPLAWISGSRRYQKDCLNENTIFSAYMLGKLTEAPAIVPCDTLPTDEHC